MSDATTAHTVEQLTQEHQDLSAQLGLLLSRNRRMEHYIAHLNTELALLEAVQTWIDD